MTLITVDPFPVTALAALFDDGLPAPVPGDPLPPYWQLAACAIPRPSGTIGPDGHPRSGVVTPPAGLPRRMFAGGRLTAHGTARVGERLDRSQQVIASTGKQGRSGPLHFITVQTTYRRPEGEVVLTEEQDLVYRSTAQASAEAESVPVQVGAQQRPLEHSGEPLQAVFCADAVTLQRFSAATSNSHRIHYDYPYATQVEGYPNLVVHGPLLLLSLLEMVRLQLPGLVLGSVSFRSHSPVFAGDSIEMAGQYGTGDSLRLTAKPVGQAGPVMTVEYAARPYQPCRDRSGELPVRSE